MDNQGSHQAMSDPFELMRFVEAQNGVYERALTELKQGLKESHWMWFIFPQIEGLGRSSTAHFYAIKSAHEAKAYLEHPLLGRRLIECSNTLLQHTGKSASDIFGCPDDLKLKSSMTLFVSISESESVFSTVLGQYFTGQLDQQTLALLKQQFLD